MVTINRQPIRIVRNWKFSGGRVSVDFVNSVGGRREQGGKSLISTILNDRLKAYENLVDWAGAIGILRASETNNLLRISGERKVEGRKVFERAVALRESLYRIFRVTSDGGRPSATDLAILNEEYSSACTHQHLIHSSGKFTLNFKSMNELDAMLWHVAIDGTNLLLFGDLSRIRQCPGDDCGWLFYDASRNGSRQWCDMKTCGTLDKVRRFRARHKE